MYAAELHRTDVLNLLGRLVNLRRHGLMADDIPVQFLQDRIAVLLPAAEFPPARQVRLNGQFQCLLTERGGHGYLDFVDDWRGAESLLDAGFH
ncbi:MAG: hypothetical protein VKS61_06965 [Candidatus Sericytochromatia bacterium]|nr:hypothetical protein [Candidatus Sericytochromatia bacterium]